MYERKLNTTVKPNFLFTLCSTNHSHEKCLYLLCLHISFAHSLFPFSNRESEHGNELKKPCDTGDKTMISTETQESNTRCHVQISPLLPVSQSSFFKSRFQLPAIINSNFFISFLLC